MLLDIDNSMKYALRVNLTLDFYNPINQSSINIRMFLKIVPEQLPILVPKETRQCHF